MLFSLIIHIKIFIIKNTSNSAHHEFKWCHWLGLILEKSIQDKVQSKENLGMLLVI